MAGPQSECAVSATMVRVEYKREVAAGNPDAVKPAHGPRGADAEESSKCRIGSVGMCDALLTRCSSESQEEEETRRPDGSETSGG